MNPNLNYIRAQQRIADLQRAADHARPAMDAATRRPDSRDSRDSSPIVRALPMPTAHPSPEAWPDAGSGRHGRLEHLSGTHDSELLAHRRPLRDLQRVAREVLADVS
jgi:hypothetical protein